MKRIITGVLFSVLTFTAIAQEKGEQGIQRAIETRNFVFKASSATPQRGRITQLTSEYDLIVRPDTVISFLPYFGRAFTAPINPSEGGIKFTSSDFVYSSSQTKKGGWEIKITPKGISDVSDLYLTVFENGNATLRVNSVNRTPISFNGFVEEGKPIEKKAF